MKLTAIDLLYLTNLCGRIKKEELKDQSQIVLELQKFFDPNPNHRILGYEVTGTYKIIFWLRGKTIKDRYYVIVSLLDTTCGLESIEFVSEEEYLKRIREIYDEDRDHSTDRTVD